MCVCIYRTDGAKVINLDPENDDDADDTTTFPASSSMAWDLSRAALQVEQMVEARYRTTPLGQNFTTFIFGIFLKKTFPLFSFFHRKPLQYAALSTGCTLTTDFSINMLLYNFAVNIVLSVVLRTKTY